jgi:electron transfer flavoprotein alpha subunit
LVLGMVTGGALHRSSLEVAAAGRALSEKLGIPLSGALFGSGCGEAAQAFSVGGMSTLFVVDSTRLTPYVAEQYVAAAETIAHGCSATVILAPHTIDSAEWIPQLAFRLEAAVATDCHTVAAANNQILVTKSICGGAVQAEYRLERSTQVVTITPGSYEAASPSPPCPITAIDSPAIESRVSVLEEIPDEASSGPSLKEARIVVAGGLGVGGREHWNLITDTAAALGAAVGATRAVVESGWAPSRQQVGYSGVKIAPELYVAIGISGAVHHLVGIAQARTVVAINSDANADIFRVARFGAVGDAKVLVPAFVERVRALRANQG